MKLSKPINPRGFTLIEILVVITIIAILAAAGFAGGQFAINQARKTTALAVCKEVELGVDNFFIEYGSLPTTTEGGDDETVKTDTDVEILEVLLGFESGTNPLNQKGLRLIEIKEGKGDRGGLIYNDAGDGVLGLYDPWGGPYNIALDTDYDDRLTVKPSGAASSKTLNGRRVAVWTDGADVTEGGTGNITDDVTTW